MTGLFGEVLTDDKPRPIPSSLPSPIVQWLVASWYAPDARWKLWPGAYLTKEKAEQFAATLKCVRGHTHYVTLEVKLPGV